MLLSSALFVLVPISGFSVADARGRGGGGGDQGRWESGRSENNRSDTGGGRGDNGRSDSGRAGDGGKGSDGNNAGSGARSDNGRSGDSGRSNDAGKADNDRTNETARDASPQQDTARGQDSAGATRSNANTDGPRTDNGGDRGKPSAGNGDPDKSRQQSRPREWGEDLPQTVEEMFKRWFKPQQEARDEKPSQQRGLGTQDHERHATGRGHGEGRGQNRRDRDKDEERDKDSERGRSSSSEREVRTGSLPVVDTTGPSEQNGIQAAQSNAASQATTKTQGRSGSRPIGGLTVFDPPLREVLGVNLSQKTIDHAVAQGFKVLGRSSFGSVGLNVMRLEPPAGMETTQAQEFLRRFDTRAEVGPNNQFRIFRTATGGRDAQPKAPKPMPTPCGTDRCLGPATIGWHSELAACSDGLAIGVVDTAVDGSHPAFKGRKLQQFRTGKEATSSASDAQLWHGTGILAQLAGDPKSETPGLAPRAKYFVADVFAAGSDGIPVSDTFSIVKGLNWLGEQRVRVVNMSLAGPPDDVLKRAIEGLSKKETIFVAAVGNDGANAPPAYPSAYPDVIAVTAVTGDLIGYRHAGRGRHVDVAAPGVKIWTAAPSGRADYHSGTSFAAPYATATVASIYRNLRTKTKAEALESLSYVDLGDPGRDPVYGRGLMIAPSSCDPKGGPAATPFVTSFKPTERAALNR